MGSKRAKRIKRKSGQDKFTPVVAPAAPKTEQTALPGARFCRISGVMLMLGGILSAAITFYAMSQVRQMSEAEFIAMTARAGQTPALYLIGIILTSVAGVFQFLFGFTAWRQAENPFYGKKLIIMGVFLIALQTGIQLYMMQGSGVQPLELVYGAILPVFLIWGGARNLRFAKAHPDYPAPELPKLFGARDTKDKQ